MLPGDRLICAFVEQQTVHSALKRWPLHVTIVPWFRLDDASERLAQGLTRALKEVSPFETVMDGAAFFGIKKNRPVRLIAQPTPFSHIEAKARTYLHKKRALLIDETTKRRVAYRPHVTNQGMMGLSEGATFWCERIYIVEQRGDYKEIVSDVTLERTNT